MSKGGLVSFEVNLEKISGQLEGNNYNTILNNFIIISISNIYLLNDLCFQIFHLLKELSYCILACQQLKFISDVPFNTEMNIIDPRMVFKIPLVINF